MGIFNFLKKESIEIDEEEKVKIVICAPARNPVLEDLKNLNSMITGE